VTLPPTPESFHAATLAIRYLLDRIQVDPDLRWHMLGTESFALLCRAEAAFTGVPEDQVQARREADRQPAHRHRRPSLPLARELIAELCAAGRSLIRGGVITGADAAERRLAAAIDAAERGHV